MHALILAGGDGSRLLATGVTTPKALVQVAGTPQVVRMITACRRVGCGDITCAVREDLVDHVRATIADASVRIVAVRTPTSLHTLAAGLQAVPAGPVLCTLVDTVMPAADWDAMHGAAAAQLHRAAAVVAVTPFVEDRSPLWVDADDAGLVRAFGRRGARDLVTGGVYWFDDPARAAAHDALHSGVQRLRGFLGRLVERQLPVRTVEVRKIVDVDTSADLDAALALVGGEALS
jgi:NDP-sugar pyrophosphorylase family protein